MRWMTEEEMKKTEEKIRRIEKRAAVFDGMLSILRTIVYTPLSIAFHAVSFLARGVGAISSFGLLLAAYYLYKGFTAFKSGVPLGQIEVLQRVPVLVLLPFIAYAIAAITECIYGYFEDHAF